MLSTDGIPFAGLCKPGERYLLLKIAETGRIYKKNQMLPLLWSGQGLSLAISFCLVQPGYMRQTNQLY